MTQCYFNDTKRQRPRSHIENLCHAADRFSKLKNVLKESENDMLMEYNRSHKLKNVEHALKSRLITVYACHEMLQQLSNDPRQWPTESDIMELADATELKQHMEEKRKYLEMVNLGCDLSKVFQEADEVLGDTDQLSFFRNLYSANKGCTLLDSGEGRCSEEFGKLYETKAEVENVIKDKRHQIELKRQELEMLELQKKCGDVVSSDQKKVLQNLKAAKIALESRPRKAVQENNAMLGVLVQRY